MVEPRGRGSTHKLGVSVRQVQGDGGPLGSQMSVQCPTVGCTVVVDECVECRRWAGLYLDPADGESFVYCAGEGVAAAAASPRPVPEAPPPGERMGDTPISAVMTRKVVCVHPDLGLDALALLLVERGISGVPVVDPDGRPVGMVSKTDVLRELRYRGLREDDEPLPPGEEAALGDGDGGAFEGPCVATVADAMTPIVFSLPETAPLSHAAALMVVEGVHRLPVLSSDGRVIGLLSAFDVMRWLARKDGYLP